MCAWILSFLFFSECDNRDVNSSCCYGPVYHLDSWRCLRSLVEVQVHIQHNYPSPTTWKGAFVTAPWGGVTAHGLLKLGTSMR